MLLAPLVSAVTVYCTLFLALNSPTVQQALFQLLSDRIYGGLTAGHVEVSPTLMGVDLYDALMTDQRQRPVVEVEHIGCRLAMTSVFSGAVDLVGCNARNGRALVAEDDNGYFGIAQVFGGAWRNKRRVRRPVRVRFHGAEIENVDVIVQVTDMFLYFESMDARGDIDTGPPRADIRLDAEVRRGRILMSERTFSLGPGRHTAEQVAFDVLRRTRPWVAAHQPLPPTGEHGYGMLEVPISDGQIRGFHWLRDDFRVQSVVLNGPELSVVAGGQVRLVPERPQLPRAERGLVYYDGTASLTIPPTSTLFSYFFPGLVVPALDDAVISPLTFNGFGTLRFYDGMATRLHARSLQVAGLRVDEADLTAEIHNGQARLLPGSWIQAYGARLTGLGAMTPRTGEWSLSLCSDGLNILQIVESFMPVTDGVLRNMLDLRLATSPITCVPDEPVGLALWGDLTRKALEISPAATTLAGKDVQPPMLQWQAGNLQLRWASSPALLPVRTLLVDSAGQLTQRGEILPIDGPLVRVRTPGAQLSLDGGMDLVAGRWISGRATVSLESLDTWLRPLGVDLVPSQVALELESRIDGSVLNPELTEANLTVVRSVRDAAAPDFRLQTRLHQQGNQLLVDALTVTSWLGEVNANGSLGVFDGGLFAFRSDPSIRLQLDVPTFRVGRLVPTIGAAAVASGQFDITGTVFNPQVSGTEASVENVSLGGEPIDRIEVESLTLRDDLLEVRGLELDKGVMHVAADLSWDVPSGELGARMRWTDIDLREFEVLESSGLAARGTGQMLVELQGRVSELEDARLSGYLTLRDVSLQGSALGDLSLVLDSWDGVIHGAGNLGADIQLSAAVPWDGTAATLDARFAGLSVADWWPAASEFLDRSRVSGQLHVRSAWWDDGSLEATATIEETDFWMDGRAFEAARPWRLRMDVGPDEAGVTQVDVRLLDWALALGDRELQARGRLRIGEGSPELTLSVSGGIDASLLKFLPSLVVDASGDAELGLKVDGPLSNPRVAGHVEHDELSIAPRGLGASVLLHAGRFSMDAERILFPTEAPLRGNVFGGEFEAAGEVGLRFLLPSSVDMSVFFSSVAYRVPEVMNVTVGGDIRFVAEDLLDYDSWSLRGDIDLLDGRFIQNFDILSGYFALGSFGRNIDVFALPVWRQVEAVRRMSVDLSITGRDRFFVDSRVANAAMNLEMRTDLEVGGTFGNMDVRGEMESLAGSRLVYRGRTFDSRLLILHFEGVLDDYGYPMPRLEAELVSTIRPCVRRQRDSFESTDGSNRNLNTVAAAVLVTAFLDGQLPYDLSFRLESTPFYDQRDQLSLILTGCTVDELTASQAGAPTLDVVLRPVLDLVERNVEERLAFDDVDFIPTTQGSAGILIQDEITERFSWTLDATVGAGEQNQQIIRGAYRLFDWLIVEVQEQTNRVDNIRVDGGLRFRLVLD